MSKDKILEALRRSKKEVEANFHIKKLGLFGSYASDTQTPGSDVDILYEVSDGFDLGLKEVYELENFFKALLEVEHVDLVDSRYLNPVIEMEIQDAVIYV